tara:strand:+ start:136 stop:954 length:819 start_codon:yes stop_codon:yes gene_type:complete
MPELPEVQTVVNYLNPIISGKTIKSISNPNGYKNVFDKKGPSYFNSILLNKTIKNVTRRGKYIIININSEYLLIHLRMTGKLQTDKPSLRNMKYISFEITFNDNTNLYFHDVRKFGKIYHSNNLAWLEKKIGIEPLSKKFNSNWLYNNLKHSKRMIKPFLMDQKFIAGLGNIYVDEALWESSIYPKTKTNRISKKKTERLTMAIKNILNKAISYQGTTIINFTYGQNKIGNFSDELQIFGQKDKPCPRCQEKIQKIFVDQRGTHFCKICQKY